MVGRLIRCTQGHVFDAASHNACPVCGEQWETQPAPPKPPSPDPRPVISPKLLASLIAALAIVVVGATALKLLPSGVPSGQNVSADLRDKNTTAEPVVREAVSPSSNSGPAPAASRRQEAGLGISVPSSANPDSRSGNASAGGSPSSTPAPSVSKDAFLDFRVDPQDTYKRSEKGKPLDDSGLPALDYPDAKILRLQGRLQLSDLLIDTLVQFSATDSMKAKPAPRAVAILTKLSERKIVAASVELANAYFGGRGVAQNDAIALSYLRSAAEAGVGSARLTLARILSEGRIVLPDSARARELATLAARDGIAGAGPFARELGLDPSTFGPIGPELNKMATEGDKRVVALASSFIKDKLASGYMALSLYGAKFSADPDLKRDVPDLARKAATLGISNGLQILAFLYRDGALVSQNNYEAYLWYSLAHRFCGTPAWCRDEEKTIALLVKPIDRREIDNLTAAISQFVTPESDVTKSR